MIWERVEYDDATGHWFRVDLGHGEEVYVDALYRDNDWMACLFSGGHDVEIGRYGTEAAAKAGAEHWLRVRVTAWENALVRCELQDDGE